MINEEHNSDASEKDRLEPAAMVERRNVLKSGLMGTLVFAGSTMYSLLSFLCRVFSSSDKNSESS